MPEMENLDQPSVLIHAVENENGGANQLTHFRASFHGIPNEWKPLQ